MKGGGVLNSHNRLAVNLVLRGVAAFVLLMRMLRDYRKLAMKCQVLRICRRMMTVLSVVGMSGCRVLVRWLRICSRRYLCFNRGLMQGAKGNLSRGHTPRQCEKHGQKNNIRLHAIRPANHQMLTLRPGPVNDCLRLMAGRSPFGSASAQSQKRCI